ncbi:RICIN domain-containing protein [Spirillospora sp. CA-294931]|uniref:RICIN domain-containing protein n=1 Tax=Spirillospora sp. CA-294931 TaxID=3240042 RepID=UPI003D8CB5CA
MNGRRRLGCSSPLFERALRARAVAVVVAGSLALSMAAVPSVAAAPSLSETAPEPSPDVAASIKARQTGEPVEVAGQTTETTKLSAMPDGQFALETSPVPVRVKRDGVFRDADLTLERGTNGALASRASVNGVSFGPGGDDVLATMTKEGKSLTLTWPGAKLPAPVVSESSATYVNAGGTGIDLVVRSMPTGWSHAVVVRTPEAARNTDLTKIEFGVRGSGVQLKELAGSRLAAVDDAGKVVFAAPEPLMWEGDTAGDQTSTLKTEPDSVAAGPAPRAAVKPMAVEVESGTLSLTPDPTLLKAAETKFPIVLDPSWQTWNMGREADGDGEGDKGAGWAYVDRSFPNETYWKSDRLPTGREVEDGTDKRSFIRMDASLLHKWAGGTHVKVHSVDVTFDTLHAWSCTPRDVRLFNTGHVYHTTTWNSRPEGVIPDGSGWGTSWLSTASVKVGRPDCGDANTANDVKFTGANLTRLMQWATDHKWDIFTLGLYPDENYDDTHTWKVMDVDPRMVVKFSRTPNAPKDVHLTNGGTTKYPCASGSARPWVGPSRDRTARALISDFDGDNEGGAQGQPLRAEYEIAPSGKPAESWLKYVPAGGGYQKAEPDGYLHAGHTILKGDDAPTSPDGGTTWAWRVRGQDDTALSGPWSQWCEYTVDAKRPNQPGVSSSEYPEGKTSGYDSEARKYLPGAFALTPGGSGDVVKFHYKFSDGTTGTKAVALGASASVSWMPKRFGWQWVEVTSFDRAGNPSVTRKYEFGVEQPPRDAGWSMDETSGNVAHAVGSSGAANPNANMTFAGGAVMGQPGNLGTAVTADRSVRLNGSGQYGEVPPGTSPDGKPVPLVDTSKRFMFSTWVKLASTSGDQVAVSQAAADGSVFELGWLSGRWTLRHRKADGTVIATVIRDMAQAGDGTPWTSHWVSLMGGYDPLKNEIWLRTQAEGKSQACLPDRPWVCTTKWVMTPEVRTTPVSWTASPGAGALLFGGTFTGGGRTSYWNGWLDDSQLWPLAHPDESVLNVIYGESVQDREFAGKTQRLVNVNSGHCLDVAGSSTANQANVIQWTCNAGPAQDWRFTDSGDGYYTLTNPNSGKCLDVDATDGSGTSDGRNVWQDECNQNPGQLWKPEKKANGHWLVSKRSGKCLAVGGAVENPGGDVIQWSCGDPLWPEQLWSITGQKQHELDGITYRVLGAASGKCLETGGGQTGDGVDVMQWACNNGAWQDWKFVHQGNGFYTLINVHTLSDPKTAKCLEVAGGTATAGAKVWQKLCEPGAAHQSWKVASINEDGRYGYRLIAQHSEMVLQPKDGSAADGALMIQDTPQEPAPQHQVWKLGCLPDQTWRCPE